MPEQHTFENVIGEIKFDSETKTLAFETSKDPAKPEPQHFIFFSKLDGVTSRGTRPTDIPGVINMENCGGGHLMNNGSTFLPDKFNEWATTYVPQPHKDIWVCLDEEGPALVNVLQDGPLSGSDTQWIQQANQFNIMHQTAQSYGFKTASYLYINTNQPKNTIANTAIGAFCVPHLNAMYQTCYPVRWSDPRKHAKKVQNMIDGYLECLRLINTYNPNIPLIIAVRFEWHEDSDTQAGHILTLEEMIEWLRPYISLRGPDGDIPIIGGWSGTYDYYKKAITPKSKHDQIRQPIYAAQHEKYGLEFKLENRAKYCRLYNRDCHNLINKALKELEYPLVAEN